MLCRLLVLAFLLAARSAYACDQLGDFVPGSTVYCHFKTSAGDGSGVSFGGTPAVSVYKNGSATQSTAGVSLDDDFDSSAGFHLVTIDTSADDVFYGAGDTFAIVLTDGTVSGVAVAPYPIGGFSIGNSAAYLTLGTPANASVSQDIADVGSNVDAVKAKTDQLTFTVANQVDANALSGGGGATAAEIWDYLVANADTASSMGAYILQQLGLISNGTRITIADPVQSTDVSIVPGTAYTGTRQPKLTWPIASSELDLTGATVSLVVQDGDTSVFAVTGTVTNAGTASQAMEFSVTAAQSALLTRIGADSYTYQVNATWSGDSPSAPVRVFEGNVDSRVRYSTGS